MGFLSSAYYMSRMARQYFPALQKVTDKLMDRYVSSIEPEEWTDKVATVDTDSMNYKEKQESRELAIQTADLITGQCDNLAQAIQTDPVTWGAYLQEKGMDEEKLAEIQQKVDENGSVPPFELVKLAIGGSSSNEAEKEPKEPEIDNDKDSPEKDVEEMADTKDATDLDKRSAEREAELGDMEEGGNEANFGYEV